MAARHKSDKSLPPCYAMVFHGLEEVAAEEIQQELGGEIRKTSPGIVIFRVEKIDRSLLRSGARPKMCSFTLGEPTN